MRRWILVLLCAGCAQFPELDGTVSPDLRNAAYVPFEELGAHPDLGMPLDATDPEAEVLLARANWLSRRADALRRQSIVQNDVVERVNRRTSG